MYIHPYTLSPDQLSTLRKRFKTTASPVIRQRIHVLLMFHAGHSIPDIAEELSLPVQTIQSWWEHRCNDDLFQLPGTTIFQDAS